MEAKDKNSMDYEEMDNPNSFEKTYGWYIVVNRLSGNDFTKHKIVYDSNVMEALNQLSYIINYEEEQERIRRLTRNS